MQMIKLPAQTVQFPSIKKPGNRLIGKDSIAYRNGYMGDVFIDGPDRSAVSEAMLYDELRECPVVPFADDNSRARRKDRLVVIVVIGPSDINPGMKMSRYGRAGLPHDAEHPDPGQPNAPQ